MQFNARIVAYGAVAVVGAAALIGIESLHHAMQVQAEASARQAKDAEDARIAAAWERRVQRARELAANIVVADLHCTINSQLTWPIYASRDINTDQLLGVSEQPLIVFLLPGFDTQHPDGRDDYAYLQTQFADEIAVAGEQADGSAVCVIPWATQQGFGDDTPFLAQAVAAVRELSEDPLIPANPPRRIVVLGYSAGGNFAKYALTHLPPDPGGTTTDLRLITLGTPHHGSIAANAYAGYLDVTTGLTGIVGEITNDADMQQRAADTRTAQDALTSARGFRQLEPNNADVEAVNSLMARPSQPFHHLNVYSSGDDAVPKDSAVWPDAVQVDLVSYKHLDLPKAPVGSPWRRVLAVAFGTAPLSQQAVDAAAAPPPASP